MTKELKINLISAAVQKTQSLLPCEVSGSQFQRAGTLFQNDLAMPECLCSHQIQKCLNAYDASSRCDSAGDWAVNIK